MIERTKVESKKVVLIYEKCLSVMVFNRRAQTLILLFCTYCTHTVIHKARSITRLRRELCLTRTLARLSRETGARRGGARQTCDTCNNDLVPQVVIDSSPCIKEHQVQTSQHQHHSLERYFQTLTYVFNFQHTLPGQKINKNDTH